MKIGLKRETNHLSLQHKVLEKAKTNQRRNVSYTYCVAGKWYLATSHAVEAMRAYEVCQGQKEFDLCQCLKAVSQLYQVWGSQNFSSYSSFMDWSEKVFELDFGLHISRM